MEINFQEIYQEFKHYPLKPSIKGCPHCELKSVNSSLHSKSLESLSWDDFQVFIFKSMTTFGDVEDFKHFLPRIFELYITDYWNAPYDFELLLSKLTYAKFESWEQHEKKTIKVLYQSWVNQLQTSGLQSDLEILEDIESDVLSLS
ncbi:hypothetical protein MHM98_15245 [Psychrobium sp. MM17-31]|uniref:hypothetical protein n=1 Tax=Psychrobium sp. MM17-31 TaxID=2917758 RepID=UPI001EF49B8A|nr:hypothetical protein [Psychrobium sp. MM17-31]MCG7532689.1 hypothetical protein [Psychrobium sp. MM17-31]